MAQTLNEILEELEQIDSELQVLSFIEEKTDLTIEETKRMDILLERQKLIFDTTGLFHQD